MKSSAFYQTIGFKLAMWYTALLILFAVLLLVSVNLAMWQARRDIPRVIIAGAGQQPAEVAVIVGDKYREYLRNYTLIGFGGLVVLGGVGGYFLSRQMLRPIDKVTTLAADISTTNLKQRINYQGPDDEMKRLADTFDDMLGRLERSFDSQKQFIQDASHELRTPIAITRTNIELLEMEKKPTAKDYQHMMEVLKLSIERMNRLNDKLLWLSRDSHQPAENVVVDMAALMHEVVMEFEQSARSNQVELTLEPPAGELPVRGDSLALKQAVSNLVDNSIRYNRPGGKVEVFAQKKAGKLVIKVKDDGPGIARKEQDKIFDRFYRVDKSRSRQKGGSGLGLAIVKEIVTGHGGSIAVSSATGKGSTFSISLPLASSR